MARPRTGPTFKEDTYAGRLLRAVALSGEFPYKSLYLLGGSDTILKRNVLSLKKNGYINVTSSGPLKTIRVSSKTFDELEKIGLLDHYMFMSNGHKFSGNNNVQGERSLWRNHRMAEVMCMLEKLNVMLNISQKPMLSLNPGTGGAELAEEELIFYTSKEMKKADEAQRYKYEFSRIMGLLFSPGGIYAIYNTNEGRIKWKEQGEIKAKVLSEDIVKRNCTYKAGNLNHAIIFAKDISIADKILNGGTGPKDENDMEFLSLKRIYENMHLITLDGNGLFQLLMMTQKDWKKVFQISLFPKSFLLDKKNVHIDADAFDKENRKYILQFLDGDISRLKRFHDAAAMPNQKGKFEIVAFDWQKDFLEEYFYGIATINAITQEQLSDYINKAFE